MASSMSHDLIIHFNNNQAKIENVDPNKYLFIELTNDIFEATIDDSTIGMGMTISIQVLLPNSTHMIELKSDADVLHLFEMHQASKEIHLHLKITSITRNLGLFKVDNVGMVGRNDIKIGNESVVPHIPTEGVDVGVGISQNIRFDRENLMSDSGFSGEAETYFDEEELYEFTSDDDDWAPDSDDQNSQLDGNKNVELEDMVVVDSLDELSDLGSDIEEGYHGSSDFDKEGIAIDRSMVGIPFELDESGKIKLVKDMLFRSVYHFREVFTDFAIQEGFDLHKVKNDKSRVTAYCRGKGCNWKIHATTIVDGKTFKIKICEGEHTCVRLENNSFAVSSAWIAKKLGFKLLAEPNMSYNLIQHELSETYGLLVNPRKLYRAKKRVMEESEGTYARSYKMLHLYAQIVRDTNPGSIAIMQLERFELSMNPTFKRFFLSFDAMKKGFSSCRPFIGVDGCHLKGPYGGVLLAAVALDGNFGLFPVAIAVVELENKDSWGWFMELLNKIVGGLERPLAIMSDGQKGLDEIITNIMPYASQRKCARHLFSNFRQKFSGLELKVNFWKAVKAPNQWEWKQAMDKIKEENNDAYNWLIDKPLQLWARHTFDPAVKSDHVTNNMVESFNNWIGTIRSKPILTLLEGIRVKLMNMFNDRYEKACSWDMTHCTTPKFRKKLSDSKHLGRCCKVSPANEHEFNVFEGSKSFVVNLQLGIWSCSCGFWQISGLPCKHAATCITYKRADIELYCHSYYSKKSFMLTYNELIYPIPDIDMNEFRGQVDEVEPPILRRMPGGPKKNRRRELGEPVDSEKNARIRNTVKCSFCQKLGHNKRNCPRAPAGKNIKLKKKIKIASGSSRASVVTGVGASKTTSSRLLTATSASVSTSNAFVSTTMRTFSSNAPASVGFEMQGTQASVFGGLRSQSSEYAAFN